MQGSNGNYEDMMRKAELEKNGQNDDLQERLRRRRKLNEEKLAAKQLEIENELHDLDIEQVVEQEKAAEEAHDIAEQ